MNTPLLNGPRPHSAPVFRFAPSLAVALALATGLALALAAGAAHAFCGFYVASGEAKLFNKASKVVLVRDEDRTVMTMANDFKGEPKQFAIVIPVPVVLHKDQVHIGDRAVLDHLDAYSAPRLVEYFDENPCAQRPVDNLMSLSAGVKMTEEIQIRGERKADHRVTIEDRYTVGEYDILILSAKESSGLESWLRENGYRVPAGASRVLGTYIKQNLKFFVAKVNLKEQQKLGFTQLRPIQVAYESPKFMLPVRLGMVNADGPQELFVFTITKNGRVETTNYRTIKLPSDLDVPEFVKAEFADVYRATFTQQVRVQDMTAVFTEYAWDMGWCDPCASQPLTNDELRALGVFWAGGNTQSFGRAPSPTFLTRLHVRYDAAHFPEDLVFQQTADRANFQARYVIRHEWTGTEDCGGAEKYHAALPARRAETARNLAQLTGWELETIRGKMAVAGDWSRGDELKPVKWYQRLWDK